MNVFLLILAGIILLILLILFSPVVIKVVYDGKAKLRVGLLFPVFSISLSEPKTDDPKKQRKLEKKKQKKEAKKQKKAEKKKLKEEKKKAKKPSAKTEKKVKKENFIHKKIKADGLEGLIELLKEFASILGYAVKKITDHLVISKMDLKIALGGDDAAKIALNYGRIGSAVYPSIAFIQQHVKKCRHKETILPAFAQEDTRINFVMKIKIQPFFVISAAIGSAVKAFKLLSKKKS